MKRLLEMFSWFYDYGVCVLVVSTLVFQTQKSVIPYQQYYYQNALLSNNDIILIAEY